MYRLKKGQESFTAVEGPCEGKTYKPGETYAEVPPGEERRFDDIGAAPARKAAAPAAAEKKPAKAETKRGTDKPSEKGEVR